jgi:hypothetical protein
MLCRLRRSSCTAGGSLGSMTPSMAAPEALPLGGSLGTARGCSLATTGLIVACCGAVDCCWGALLEAALLPLAGAAGTRGAPS